MIIRVRCTCKHRARGSATFGFGAAYRFGYFFSLCVCVDADMIYDNAPLTNRYISVPKDFGSFNCAVFIGGILQGMLEQTNFVSENPLCPSPEIFGLSRVSSLAPCSRVQLVHTT
jgi:hypothetical protein